MAAGYRRFAVLNGAGIVALANVGCMGLPSGRPPAPVAVSPMPDPLAQQRAPLEALQPRTVAQRPEWDRPGGLGQALTESRKPTPGITEPAGGTGQELADVEPIPVAVAKRLRTADLDAVETPSSMPSERALAARRAENEVVPVSASAAESPPTLAAPRAAGSASRIVAAEPPAPPPLSFTDLTPGPAPKKPPAAKPAPPPEATEPPSPPLAKAEAAGPFRIGRMAWCEAVAGKGQLEGETKRLVPGAALLLYAEAAGFALANGSEATLHAVLELVPERGAAITVECAPVSGTLPPGERDLFCHFEIPVPEDLPPGPCKCVLRLRDQVGKAAAEQVLNAEVRPARKEN